MDVVEDDIVDPEGLAAALQTAGNWTIDTNGDVSLTVNGVTSNALFRAVTNTAATDQFFNQPNSVAQRVEQRQNASNQLLKSLLH